MTKAEIAGETYSRMSRVRMSATPVRGAVHSDSSQIAGQPASTWKATN